MNQNDNERYEASQEYYRRKYERNAHELGEAVGIVRILIWCAIGWLISWLIFR